LIEKEKKALQLKQIDQRLFTKVEEMRREYSEMNFNPLEEIDHFEM
jgi:hypothetical protein